MNTHAPDPVEARSSWYQWTLAFLTLATLLFGFWGYWLHENRNPAHHPSILTVLYHTCQLLIAHGVHLEGSIHWQLHVGRLCGVALLFTAAFVAFAKFFRQELRFFSLRLPWRRNHVLICGLGDLGLRLAMDASRRGKFAVAIEKQGHAAAMEQARGRGVLVIEGDACDVATLHKLRVERAEFIVAACRDDQTNVAIAAIAGQLVSRLPERSQPLVCRLLINDHKLRELLADESLFPTTNGTSAPSASGNYRINFQDLHVQDLAARQALRRFPLDFRPIHEGNETVVRLIVVGFGGMGQSLALHAIRIAHFANGVNPGRRLRVTLVDSDAKSKLVVLKSQYPRIDHVCDLDPVEADRNDPGLVSRLDELTRETDQRKELVTFAICFERAPIADDREHTADDRENMRIGIELSRQAQRNQVQFLTYQSTRCGFAALFHPEAKGSGLSPRLHAFGMVEDIFTWDTLLHESEDRLARALHEDYWTNRREEGVPEVDNPKWETLRDDFKDSNRYAADHIPIKLRALGYHQEPLQPGKESISRFTEKEIDVLAQMEHLRWCAERWLAGWEHGPETDRKRRINKCLTDWKDLPPKEQKKDPEQVNAIARALHVIGHGIYRT